MLTQDVRVHYQGFQPGPMTEMKLASWADEIHDEAPSDACLKATYTKSGRTYQGMIRITSRAGEFFAIARGPNLYAVARQAMDRIRRQLKKWKDVRHHRHVEQPPLDQSMERSMDQQSHAS